MLLTLLANSIASEMRIRRSPASAAVLPHAVQRSPHELPQSVANHMLHHDSNKDV